MTRKMEIKTFSKKQLTVLSWWNRESVFRDRDAIICDGAVRSGKTFCMSLSFILWSFYDFANSDFALCGKTIRSLRRNMITPVIPILKSLGFKCEEKLSQNILTVSVNGVMNRFYLFGGKDESSASLIQGMTLSGVLFDEVALMRGRSLNRHWRDVPCRVQDFGLTAIPNFLSIGSTVSGLKSAVTKMRYICTLQCRTIRL